MFIIATNDKGLISTIACHPKRTKLDPVDANGERLYQLSCDEVINACILIKSSPLYFDPITRNFTNANGDIMFNSNNGTQATYLVGDNSKEYVCKIKKEMASKFIETLLAIKQEEKKYIEMQARLEKQLNKINSSVVEHVQTLEKIHDEMAKELAMSNYNEFRHKIHVDEDGSLYVIPKNTEITLSDLIKDEDDV